MEKIQRKTKLNLKKKNQEKKLKYSDERKTILN